MNVKQQKLAIVIDGATGYVIDGSGAIIATRPAEVLVSCTRDEAIAAVKNYKKAQDDAKQAQAQWVHQREWHEWQDRQLDLLRKRLEYTNQDPWLVKCDTLATSANGRSSDSRRRPNRKPTRIQISWTVACKQMQVKLYKQGIRYQTKEGIWKAWCVNVNSNLIKRMKRIGKSTENQWQQPILFG